MPKGKKPKYFDDEHKLGRRNWHRWKEQNKDVLTLAGRLGVKITEARGLLQQNPDLAELTGIPLTAEMKKRIEEVKGHLQNTGQPLPRVNAYGVGGGAKPIYHDVYHKVARERQQTYQSEIRRIARENNCSLSEARKIRKGRKRHERYKESE